MACPSWNEKLFAVLIIYNLILLTISTDRLDGIAHSRQNESNGFSSFLDDWIELSKLIIALVFLIELLFNFKNGIFACRKALFWLDFAIVLYTMLITCTRWGKVENKWQWGTLSFGSFPKTGTGFDPSVFRIFRLVDVVTRMYGSSTIRQVLSAFKASMKGIGFPVLTYSMLLSIFAVWATMLFGNSLSNNCCPSEYSIQACKDNSRNKRYFNLALCAVGDTAVDWGGYECDVGFSCMEGQSPMFDQLKFDTVTFSSKALFQSSFSSSLGTIFWVQDAKGWLTPILWFVIFGAFVHVTIINTFTGAIVLTMRRIILKEEAEVKISNSGDGMNNAALAEFELYRRRIHATYEADVERCLKKLRLREIARSYKSDNAPGEDIIESQSFLVKLIVHERSPLNIASILLIIVYVVIITLKDAIIVNVIFSILFGLEIVIRCCLLGKERYLKDPYSQFDIIFLFVAIADVIVDVQLKHSLLKRSIALQRSVQFLKFTRMSKLAALTKPSRLRPLAGKLGNISHVSTFCSDTLRYVVATLSILATFWFMMAVLGMQLFSGRMYIDSRDSDMPLHNVALYNFDTFPMALYSVAFATFLIDVELTLTQAVRGMGDVALAYFVVVMVIGRCVAIGMIIAVLFNQVKLRSLKNIEKKGKDGILAVYTMNYHLSKLLYRFVWMKWQHFISVISESSVPGKLFPAPCTTDQSKDSFYGLHEDHTFRIFCNKYFFGYEVTSILNDTFFSILFCFGLLIIVLEAEGKPFHYSLLVRTFTLAAQFLEFFGKSVAYGFNHTYFYTFNGIFDIFLLICTSVEIIFAASCEGNNFKEWVYLGAY